ncbi:hypothetical protein HELRODRAFT_189253 [Helobdella robusta]|uniref:FERM domain-containing protein n=1 Tax=Helobdella robusta TaxID=6412 RepID=T1FQV5_HELRO|nr:hypothetical protein HELRODRAFT_189253 [Helobdella robusta]ESN96459.1 hypothetical protein HELRODRAFT_189253 [Helobdella robusta]
MLSLKIHSDKKLDPKKCFDVLVKVCDNEMMFSMKLKAKGKDLMCLVSDSLGLREMSYFGMQFEDVNNDFVWLVNNKQILSQKVKCRMPREFTFTVKYYPENLTAELIQDQTIEIFFSTVLNNITCKDLFKNLSGEEVAISLMALELQTKVASCAINMRSEVDAFTDQLFKKYQITKNNQNEELFNLQCSKVKMLSKVDAELEYLGLAQQFKCFGVTYFNIKRNKTNKCVLGITNRGINVYNTTDVYQPCFNYTWNQISNVSFSDKKFMVRMVDRSMQDFIFFVDHVKTNKTIIQLCMGNHELFMCRRRPEPREMQQLKIISVQARKQKTLEREMMVKEREANEVMERRIEEQRSLVERLQLECQQLQQQLTLSQDALVQSEQSCDLLSERVMLLEEEIKLLDVKVKQQELDLYKADMASIQMEQDRIMYERRALEAEILASQVVEECDSRSKEADQLRLEMMEMREEELKTRNKYRQLLQLFTNLEKTKHLQQKLKHLKSEIQVLRVDKPSTTATTISNNHVNNNSSHTNNNNTKNDVKNIADDDNDNNADDDTMKEFTINGADDITGQMTCDAILSNNCSSNTLIGKLLQYAHL